MRVSTARMRWPRWWSPTTFSCTARSGQGCTIVAPDLTARLGGGGVPASRLRAGGVPGRSATVVPIDEALAYRRRIGRIAGGRTGSRYR